MTSTALSTASDNDAIRAALKNSLYPGAADQSIDMVMAYCQAAKLDVMTKPVHIVPMSVDTGRKDADGWPIKEKRDVIMPGIGLYRTNASRTGQYAGVSKPEFGPTQTLHFKRDKWTKGPNNRRVKTTVDGSIQHPEWCEVTVTKLVNGQECKFTAKEYWLENYAEKGDGGGPNSMWEKRPFAQLAKCAEAQALRKAFPESVGSQPTAEEMEGKTIDVAVATISPAPQLATEQRGTVAEYPAEDFEKNLEKWRAAIDERKKTADQIIAKIESKGSLSDAQKARIRAEPAGDNDHEGEAE